MTTYPIWTPAGHWSDIQAGDAWLIPRVEPPTDILGLIAWAQPRARLQRLTRAAATEGADHLAERIGTAARMLDQVGAAPADVVRAELGEIRADLTAHRWANDPDRKRGAKVVKAASEGGAIRAAETSMKDRAAAMQEAIDDAYALHPDWSYERIKASIAKSHGYSLASLKRHTTNPRRK